MSEAISHGFLHDFDEEPTATPASGRHPSVVDRLLEASLIEALGTKGKRRLADETCLTVILEVPSASWIEPLESVAGRFCRSAKIVGVMPPRKRIDAAKFDDSLAAATLAAGKSLVVVTADRTLLPNAFVATADVTARLEIPGLRAVRGVIEATCIGPARVLRRGDLAGLSLFHLVYAIRPGPARASIERLRAASVAKSSATLRWADAPRVDDLVGYGAAKIWAKQVVADVARHRMGESVRLVSCLLAGPPGTGKTRLVQSIAKTAGLTLVETSVASWFAHSAGDLGDVLRSLVADVDRALETAPSLLFLDELDAIPSRAGLGPRGADWWTPVVTGLILEIDRLSASPRPVLLVAATNHPKKIDPAIVRPGRIGLTIEMTIPDGDDLAGIFRHYCGQALSDAEIRSVVDIVGSATGAEVVGWVEEARRRAEEGGGAPFGLRHLLDVVAPEDPGEPEFLRDVAVHEAAHAVAALALGLSVDRISVLGQEKAAGMTSISTPSLAKRLDFEKHLVVALAGRVGDEEFGQGANVGAEVDLAAATRIACTMRGTLGLSDSLTHHDPDVLVRRLGGDREFAELVETDLRRAKAIARTILLAHREEHAALVEALLSKKVLAGAEIATIGKIASPPVVSASKVSKRSRRTPA